MTASPLLDVSDLHVELRIGGGLHPVIHNLSLQIGAGEALGLVVRVRTARGETRAIEVNVGARYGTNQKVTHLRCHPIAAT